VPTLDVATAATATPYASAELDEAAARKEFATIDDGGRFGGRRIHDGEVYASRLLQDFQPRTT